MSYLEQFPEYGTGNPVPIPPPAEAPLDTPETISPPLTLIDAPEPNRKAWWLRGAANVLSVGRAVGGAVLTYRVATSEYPCRSWGLAAVAAGLAATDFIDGRLAREARSIDGLNSRFGAYADQLSDKVFVNGLMGATAVANFREGNRAAGTLLAAETGITTARDVGVTVKRVQAERSDIPVDTAAQKSGKVKAAIQFVGLIASLTPLMKNNYFNMAVQGVLLESTRKAVESGLEYQKAYSAAMKHRPSPVLKVLPTEG